MKTTTGYCAANYRETDRYDESQCGPIRETSEQAQSDADNGEYDGVRYVHTDGYLYVDQQQ